MNFKSVAVEIFIIVILGVLALSTINPYFMPMGMQLTVLLALTVLFGVFAAFVWREQGGDERERFLLRKSDRIAFLCGATVLLIAIVVEGIINHMPNPWIVGALAIMVIAKATSYIYNTTKN